MFFNEITDEIEKWVEQHDPNKGEIKELFLGLSSFALGISYEPSPRLTKRAKYFLAYMLHHIEDVLEGYEDTLETLLHEIVEYQLLDD